MFDKLISKLRPSKAQTFDVDKWVGQRLLELPRCSSTIVIASPATDPALSCSLLVGAPAVQRWVEANMPNSPHIQPEERAAWRAFHLWLQSADILNSQVTVLPPEFKRCLGSYVYDFVNKGVTTTLCHICNKTYDHVAVENTNHTDSIIQATWDTRWRCPAGHVIYEVANEIHISYAD